MHKKIIVVGVGEVGGPLLEIISEHHDAAGVDIKPAEKFTSCEVLHICFPFVRVEPFVKECVRYIREYKPSITIINSTVAPGTTRLVAEQSGSSVVYSPVRGKHSKMKADMKHYAKFVGAMDAASGEKAAAHFRGIGLTPRVLTSPEAAELAKLTETTYFGLLIAWAQEVERYCDQVGASYEEVISFYEEIKFLPPVKYFPGVIGGHCVMPNIKILKQHFSSEILAAIESSNSMKMARSEPRSEEALAKV